MLTSLYRRIVPIKTRTILYNIFLGKILFIVRHFNILLRGKFTYLFNFILPKTEKNQIFAFFGKYGITSYPYNYKLEYDTLPINVYFDIESNLHYVLHNEKKLYFPEFYSDEKIIKDYKDLLIEQDIRSAHRYVKSYNELTGKTLLDVGSAEGIFALDTIEIIKNAIVFECEDHWLKPLNATFAPWHHKVTFVKKYVGNKTKGNFITIDDYFSNQPQSNIFIKMDIEGAERKALEGATNILMNSNNIQLAICTYHRENDPEYIANLMIKYGYSIEFTEGFMYWNKRLSKGVIRCIK
jgi:hypothetical protein